MWFVVLPVVAVSIGVGTLVTFLLASSEERDVPVHEPDLPPNAPPPPGFPKSTGYKLVDKVLPILKQVSDANNIPLGVIVGWIAKESGGKLATKPQPGPGDTKLDERGIFQLHPDESKALGLDHQRLSTDLMYSINAGIKLIEKYMKRVDKFDIAAKGSTYYWMLVKLCHTMGSGATQKIVDTAKAAGAARTWARLVDYALSHEKELLHATKHSPTKWLPFVDKIYKVGVPFGFGSADTVVGGVMFADIVDPLNALG